MIASAPNMPRADSRLGVSQLTTHVLTESPNRSFIQPENRNILDENATLQLAVVFNSLLTLESDVERARETLSLANDFNLNQLFDVFDPIDKGYINSNDVQLSLQSIGVYSDEIEPVAVLQT